MADDNKDTEILDDKIQMRVRKQEFDIFKAKSKRVTGKNYDVFLREMITAFNDGRLRIELTDEQKEEQFELYK